MKETTKNIPSVANIFKAAEEGLLEDVRYFIDRGDDIYDDEYGEFAINAAARRGFEEVVRFMFEEGNGDVWARDDFRTTLHAATWSGNLSLARYLVEELGMEVEALDRFGETPLHEAAAWGESAEIVRYLLARGADPNRRGRYGETPLHKAFNCDRYDFCEESDEETLAIVQALVDAGADVRALVDGEGFSYGAARGASVLGLALRYSGKCVDYLLEKGAADGDGGGTTFWEAAESGSLSLTRFWVERLGADVAATDEDGRTAIHRIAACDECKYFCDYTERAALETIEYLLSNGADVSARDASGKTPLDVAKDKCKREIVDFLRERGGVETEDDADEEIKTTKETVSKRTLLEAMECRDDAAVERALNDTPNLEEREKWNRKTPLILAAEKRRSDWGARLLELGADVSAFDSRGKTALHYATERGDVAFARLLLDAGADVWARNGQGYDKTAVRVALEKDAVELTRLFVERRPERWKDAEIRNAGFQVAAENAALATLRLFLNRFEEDAPTTKKRLATASRVAAKLGDLTFLRFLVEERGALEPLNAEETDEEKERRNAVFYAASRAGSFDVVRYLVERRGVDVSRTEGWRNEALRLAAERGSFPLVRYLVEELGAEVDEALERDGTTATLKASRAGAFDVVKFLVDRGASVATRSNNGRTPLHAAVEQGDAEIVRFLIEKGADIEARSAEPDYDWDDDWEEKEDEYRRWGHKIATRIIADAPLHIAAKKGRLAAAKVLLENGADLEARNGRGETPFLLAVKHSNWSLVRYLAKRRGADVFALDSKGRSAYYHACYYQNTWWNPIRFLLERGVELTEEETRDFLRDAPNYDGWDETRCWSEHYDALVAPRKKDGRKAIHIAAKAGDLTAVKRLVEEWSADPFLRDAEGKTPLDFAGSSAVREYLTALGERREGKSDEVE